MADVLAALNNPSTGLGQYGTFSLDSNGQLSFTASSTPAPTLSVTSDTTSWAGGPSLTQLFGITPGVQADLTTTYAINPTILQNPGALPLASVNLSAPAGTPAVSTGDGSGAQAMADAANATTTFMAAGGNPGGTSTITDYASNLAGAIGEQAQQNTSNQTQADSMQSTAASTLSSAEGVNLDQQLTNLQIYQQAYGASASLLQAEQAMFTALSDAMTSTG